MKKKVALLMAAIMTVAMVPMTAFASTKLTAVDEISTAVDSEFTSRVELKKGSDQVGIKVEPEFDVTLKLTNGKFAKDDDDNYIMEDGEYVLGAGIEAVDVKSDTTATVTLNTAIYNQDEEGLGASACVLDIVAEAAETGDVVATFTSNVTAFKTASEVIATAYADEINIESEGATTFVEDADKVKTLKEISIDELVSGLLSGNTITLKLKGDFEFTETEPTVSFLNQEIDATVTRESSDEITIAFDDTFPTDNMLKNMTITGIELQATKKCSSGDVATITVSSEDFSTVKLEVAKMVEEAVTYSVEDEELPTIWAGSNNDEANTLELSIEENTGDILNTSRKSTFTFPEGIEVVNVGGIEVDGVSADFEYDIDENVVSIWNYSTGEESDKTDMSIKFTVNAAPTFAGNVDVTLGGQFDDITYTVAEVKAPYTIEAKTSDVLIDYRYVPVNEIVITEAEDGIFAEGDTILLAVEKMNFEDAGDIEVTEGDIEAEIDIDDSTNKNYAYLSIEVKEESTEASTMVISGLELFLDRTLPVGGYALTNIAPVDDDDEVEAINILWENSSASSDIYDESGMFKYKDASINDSYVNVITSGRDQDDSMLSKKIIITIGATTMTAGTETVTLDAPAYINNEDYTMLPVRAIAETFGATVTWDESTRTVTVLSGQRIISMAIGSKTMYINGTPVAMNTSAAITSDRTFIPVRDLANALGISAINWTEASGTVTLN